MAKKKKPDHDENDDQPRIGDATEFDFSLKKMDEEAARNDFADDFDLLTPASDAIPVPDLEEDGPRIGDATEATFSEIDLGAVPMASGSPSSSKLNLKMTEGQPDEEIIDLDDVQTAEASSRILDAQPVGEIDLGAIPTASASASSSNLFGTNIPAATPADSASNLEPITPVQPASGWFDEVDDVPKVVSTDAIEAAMAQSASGVIDGSDIFAGPVPKAMPKSDVSDVIAATAYSPARSAEGERLKPPSRASDVALNFDRPPGGSTIESVSGAADLPVAEEAHDSLFGEDVEADSSKFVKTPNLPSDAPDFGATPAASIDASSILADLSEPGSAPGDSSAIRLEAPGVDATLRGDSKHAKFTRDSTELDMDLPDAESTDWRSQSGSDLLGKRTEFELTPDMGKVDPFADELDVDQPSLSSAPSSIFSGTKPPTTGSGSSVPVANPDSSADAVEFSDHPDPNAADSGSFHVLPADMAAEVAAARGAVDFDIPESDDPHPERSMMAHIPEDDEDDWTNAKTDPGPSASGVNLRKRLDPTDEMAPIPATPVKGKPEKKPAAKVVPWSEDATEEEPALPKRREPKPESSGKRGLAGLALGLVLGVGASAGAYFSGVLPNQDGDSKDGAGKTIVQADPAVLTKLDAVTAELNTEKEKASKWEKDAAKFEADAKMQKTNADEADKMAAAQSVIAANLKTMTDTLAAELKTEKEKTLQAIKDGAADKEKVVTLGKEVEAEKAKTVKAEKDLVAEKDKLVKAEKDLVTEKDNTLKVEKDLKAMLDKVVADAKKDLDTAKADLTKAMDALKTETTDKTKLADAVKAKQATVDAIAKELQNAKLLSEKFDDAALLAAAKSSVSRATGPDLSKLVPPELTAVAGMGLSTGHILDLASRTNKADAAAKTAAGEIAKLKTDHATEIKAMTDAAKKIETNLKDAHATDLKKAADANTVAMDKLKVELKTAKDGVAAEVKKATDAAAVAMDKLKADADAKLKAATDKAATDAKAAADLLAKQTALLEAAVTAEKVKTAEAERRFKALGGAATLASQELDRVAALAAARNRDLGIASYKAGRYDQAIPALEEAAKHDPNDALAWYFLGATKWAQGKTDDAKADYKKGAEREALRLVSGREIDAVIGAIQGPARDALTAARP